MDTPFHARRPAKSSRTVWLLSAYHSGSHQAWAEGLQRHSRHRVRLFALDGRFWKWRMQGGAVDLARMATAALTDGSPPPDLVLATDMLNLPAWLALVRRSLLAHTPVLLYMHENQHTYPWRPGQKPDLTYAMLNWLSQLSADRIAFNSAFHRDEWFGALPRLLKHFPDYPHLVLVEGVRAKSVVLPVGIELPPLRPRPANEPPLILWNQRWEHDKRADRFFALLYRLQQAGAPFRLAVAGENFRQAPAEFEEARSRLADRIVHWGFAEGRAEYESLLAQAELVISTADHEFFGISILEAIAAGAFALLPRRLSYPELLPPALHDAVLYANREQLFERALAFLRAPESVQPARVALQEHVRNTWGWLPVVEQMDAAVEELARGA